MLSYQQQLYEFNASSGKSLSGGLKDGEHLVHYILAKPLHTDVGSMGIPAFDQGKSLVLQSPMTAWLSVFVYL